MIKVIDQLRSCAEAAKNFTQGSIGKIVGTVADALEELANTKADKGYHPDMGDAAFVTPQSFGTATLKSGDTIDVPVGFFADEHGHLSHYGKVTYTIASPMQCGTFTKKLGTTDVTFDTAFTNAPNIKIWYVSGNGTIGISNIYANGENLLTINGTVNSASKTGFVFSGVEGTFYWEAYI